MKLHAQAAFVSKRAGLEAAARHHGDEAARLLRRLDLGNDADRILALTRSAATTDRPSLKRSFDCPTFWAAFQLVGRVT
jgi:CHAT domain-containing protein